MPILKILPDAISNTESYVFGNVTTTSITANGVNLGTAVAEAFVLANNATKTTTSDTAPADPKVGDSWFDTVTNVLLRYTNDGVSNNWIDISGPQNIGYIYQSYSITPNTSTVNETTGNTVIYTVATTNTADNTVLYWTNSGTTTAADFSDSVSNGSVTITNNSGTITRRLTADLNTEDSETIVLSLRTGSNTGPIVAVATTVTVGDTSLAPEYTLYSWGPSYFGQGGLNDLDSRSSPTQVAGTTWSKISLGRHVSMAIKTNGTLWSWGYNIYGALGHNNGISRSSPVQIGATNNWSLISVGQYQAAAIKTDGTLWTWGANGNGELSQPGTYISSPTQVGTNTNWSKIVMSTAVLAIKTDGTLWSWGTNGFRGRLGQNFSTNSGTGGTLGSPTQIGTGTTWNNINVSEAMMATKTDGTLWVWGANDVGQLGIGSTQSYGRSSPVQLGSNTNWSILTRGGITGAIKTDGTLWLWGRNSYGKLGLNLRESHLDIATSPTKIGTDTNWNDVTCGTDTVLATKTNGTLWSWGQIQSGSLGQNDNYNGNFVHRSSPTQVGALTKWNQIGMAAGTGMATQSNQ
jgi:hypothetical protein